MHQLRCYSCQWWNGATFRLLRIKPGGSHSTQTRKLWSETNSEAVLFSDDVHSDGRYIGSLNHKFLPCCQSIVMEFIIVFMMKLWAHLARTVYLRHRSSFSIEQGDRFPLCLKHYFVFQSLSRFHSVEEWRAVTVLLTLFKSSTSWKINISSLNFVLNL